MNSSKCCCVQTCHCYVDMKVMGSVKLNGHTTCYVHLLIVMYREVLLLFTHKHTVVVYKHKFTLSHQSLCVCEV